MLADKSSRNFSYVTIGRIVSSALLAAFYLVFATILEPTDYGEMGFLIALAGTSSVISRFGLPQTLVVFKAKGNQELSNQVITLGVVTTSAASIILLFLDMYSALLCLGISFFFLYQHNLLGEKKYKSAMNHFILRGVLTFAIPFPLYFVPFAMLPLTIILLNHGRVAATWSTVIGAILLTLFSEFQTSGNLI